MQTITQIDNTKKELNLHSKESLAHFSNPNNYTEAILGQLDRQIYKDFITIDNKIILDIGANVGLFALHVAPYARHIICVEPTPEHINIAKELLDGVHVDFEQAAISDKTGEIHFYRNGMNTTMNTIGKGPGAFLVPCVTLENLCKKYNLTHVDLCKIDIEGSEWEAITKQTLLPIYPIIDKIIIELHPAGEESLNKMKHTFESAGYKVKKHLHETLFCYK